MFALEKHNNSWWVELKVDPRILFEIYPYIFPTSLCVYKKKSELAIKSQLIESFSTKNIVKFFTIDKSYNSLKLSYLEVKNRLLTIIGIFKDLEDKKNIDNNIYVLSKKNEVCHLKIKDLTPDILKKNRIILFQELLKID